MSEKVLFLDSFCPWTSRHEQCLSSFLKENPGTEVAFGILLRKDTLLSENDIEAILSIVHKDIKTISIERGKVDVVLKKENCPFVGDDAVLLKLGLLSKAKAVFHGLLSTQEDVRSGKRLLAPYPVLEYIADHPLFFASKISFMMHPDRYRHSVSVARTAYEIALNNGLDAIKAYQAGLFHDIAKDLDKALQRRLVKEHFPEYQDYPNFAMHQFAGAFLARTAFGIEDEEVLSAIACHCTGKEDMTLFEQTIYCADKCEPLRDYDTGHIFSTAKKDVHKGFLLTLKDQAEYLRMIKVDYHTNPLSSAMYDRYLKEVKE